jgi:nicotinate phosphoribosyltransferase
MTTINGQPSPDGVFSLLDTDLYKLTMQCAVLKYFPDISVSYRFTNRTPHMQLTRAAFNWLQTQVQNLGNIRVTSEEIAWLEKTCPYLSKEYLDFLKDFYLKPAEQLELSFSPKQGTSEDDAQPGEVHFAIAGLWVDTILYEIPLLALVSEAYFKFVDTDWNHAGQLEKAKHKGLQLLEGGCAFSEFGSRRRRDYKTHGIVMTGLIDAQKEAQSKGFKGKFSGTSNVHLAMRYGVAPVGTVAHEWFMGIAALSQTTTQTQTRKHCNTGPALSGKESSVSLSQTLSAHRLSSKPSRARLPRATLQTTSTGRTPATRKSSPAHVKTAATRWNSSR